MRAGCLSIGVALALALVMPFVFADVMTSALLKLHVGRTAATLIAGGILIGSVINVPVRRIARDRMMPVDHLAVFGLEGWWRSTARVRDETIVAVNVGGCVIPAGLALYEVLQVAQAGALVPLAVSMLVNIWVCYRLARPLQGVGIVMPGLVPPLVAATTALLLAPSHATEVAFVAGTTGPLVGADLLHLRQVNRMEAGVLSIGGAGTFDGILLSGIVALYLS